MGLKLADIEKLFRDHGHIDYAGEGVTQLEHALQCAQLAEDEQAPRPSSSPPRSSTTSGTC